mmetsp:Transcript_12381/g.16246  ORF Transcript_12381/g.16246 Transcript_12381/m.16246 type:complete len:148 (-) Transcript_12381:228-671(-)
MMPRFFFAVPFVSLIIYVSAMADLRNAREIKMDQDNNQHLFTVLCADHCRSDCVTYITPLNACYSAHQLFPDSDSWSEYDILDKIESEGGTSSFFLRYFFSSTNGTCQGNATDYFDLPLAECVGPFGPPRPWGNFSLTEKSKEFAEA